MVVGGFDSASLLDHADRLFNVARHLTGSDADAEDLVQETFARALTHGHSFVGGNLKAWLFRILRNTFIDLYRREQRARTDGGLDTVGDAAGEAVAPRQEGAVMGHEVATALAALSDEARTAVLLDLEGFSEAEIAACLGCAPGTVKSRLFRARAALRQRLGGHGGG